jgi:4-alpha-glucanotransferase
MSTLDELAKRHGIVLARHNPDGSMHHVPDETKGRILAAMGVAAMSHRDVAESLARAEAPGHATSDSAEAGRCFLPDWFERGGAWGISLQLYELRSRRNWGIGDFADLAEFCAIAARAGADFVGVNPLHALFLAEPGRRSPFSPSNRLFLNPLYIAVDKAPGFSPQTADPATLAGLRQMPLVDYDGVAAAKLSALRQAWRAWNAAGEDRFKPLLADFRSFRAEGGETLRRHALFEALSLELSAAGHGSGWTDWPEPYRDIESAAVEAFADAHADWVDFHIWLQWLADRQLAEAAEAAQAAGMRIGLYADLAVGDAPDGSATWSEPGLYARGMKIGAPPDFFSANGQDWNLAPLSPAAMAAANFAPYRRLMQASMRHAGALRIDHAMALRQLFWLPQDGSPAEGAHVLYPMERMFEAVSEVSRACRTVVIGEDLGYVPEGFNDRMARSSVLCYRPLYFQERGEVFAAAWEYPWLALACLSTHDLPTLKGWWRGGDIVLRAEHELIDPAAARAQTEDRLRRRTALARLLVTDGGLPADFDPSSDLADGETLKDLAVAAHRFLARTPSRLVAVRLADLTGESEPTNVPGTVDAYPNWRPKSSLPLDELEDAPLFRAVTEAMARERPRLP